MSLDLSDDKSTLVQVMAWCHQATSHYLSQRWSSFLSPYVITRPQSVKGYQAPLSFASLSVTLSIYQTESVMTACHYPKGKDMHIDWIPWTSTAVINRHFQNGETTCRQLSKRLPDNSSIFAAEATAISLALNYYQHMGPVHHDVVVYSDSMSCLQAIEGEDTENPFICHIMNLLWSLSDKGTRIRFCWVPSHCGIDGNERVDQLAKETLDQDIDPLASVHYTDMKPLVNSYILKLVQTKWDVAVHGRDLYLVKPTLGPPKKFQHLTRAEEVVITRLRIGHTKATKSHILSRGPPNGCHHCGQTLTIDHMLLECALLQECRDEYYTVDSLNDLFETVPETCIVEFLREAGFFYLIWCNLLTSTSPQTGQYDRTWVIV